MFEINSVDLPGSLKNHIRPDVFITVGQPPDKKHTFKLHRNILLNKSTYLSSIIESFNDPYNLKPIAISLASLTPTNFGNLIKHLNYSATTSKDETYGVSISFLDFLKPDRLVGLFDAANQMGCDALGCEIMEVVVLFIKDSPKPEEYLDRDSCWFGLVKELVAVSKPGQWKGCKQMMCAVLEDSRIGKTNLPRPMERQRFEKNDGKKKIGDIVLGAGGSKTGHDKVYGLMLGNYEEMIDRVLCDPCQRWMRGEPDGECIACGGSVKEERGRGAVKPPYAPGIEVEDVCDNERELMFREYTSDGESEFFKACRLARCDSC